MDQTSYQNYRNGTFLAPAITFTMLVVGTGGDYTPGYHALRENRAVFNKLRDASPAMASTVAADLDYIKSTLNLTMSELANCLGVSRQAPYNWIAGSPMKVGNVAKLNNLKSAADVIAAESTLSSPLLFQRKLRGGKTLVEAISSGADGEQTAKSFIELAKNEARQRQFFRDNFANRPVPTDGIYSRTSDDA